MEHPNLDSALQEIHRDVYYFTKGLGTSIRSSVEKHFKELQEAIAVAISAEKVIAALTQAKEEVTGVRNRNR